MGAAATTLNQFKDGEFGKRIKEESSQDFDMEGKHFLCLPHLSFPCVIRIAICESHVHNPLCGFQISLTRYSRDWIRSEAKAQDDGSDIMSPAHISVSFLLAINKPIKKHGEE